jgi:hypothetical protein
MSTYIHVPMYVDCSLTVDLLYGEALSDWVAWAEALWNSHPEILGYYMQYAVSRRVAMAGRAAVPLRPPPIRDYDWSRALSNHYSYSSSEYE